MNILLTNDDGYSAPGIKYLAGALSKNNSVVVCAPNMQKSASGHSLTMDVPLFYTRHAYTEFPHIPVYGISGNPVDCVKLGMHEFAKNADLVVSGMNMGPNLGNDIFYSGTVSAALEAAIFGKKAVAVSMCLNENDTDERVKKCAELCAKLIDKLDIEKDVKDVLNINIPPCAPEEIKGIALTRQGKLQYTDGYEKRKDPRDRDYYWLVGDFRGDREAPDTDSGAAYAGYISVTPLKCDFTDESELKKLKHIESLSVL